MKEINEYEKDLTSIRTMMERSVKFVSLSGLSGILSGTYALIGSVIVYIILYSQGSPFDFYLSYFDERSVMIRLLLIAISVLVLSLATGYLLSLRKAKKAGVSLWNAASQQLFRDLFIPLLSGGLLLIIFLFQGYYGIAAPTCLVFYGLALVQGSRNTFTEVLYLGLVEIALGLACAALPGYGLIFWATGFGVMHILYGTVMYFRYDR